MSHTPKKYCYDKVAKPTTALYYSLRRLTLPERDKVVAVHAFYQEMQDIVFQCKNIEVALQKFNWWRSEIAKMALGKSEHPIMQMFQLSMQEPVKLQPRLLAIIDGVQQNLMPSLFANFEDVVIYLMRTAGARELLIQELLNSESSISTEILYQLMLVIELVNYLQHLRDYIQREIFYFPEDELKNFSVSHAMLHELKTTEEIKKLLNYQAEKIDRSYVKAMGQLDRLERRQLSHLLIRAEISRSLLRAFQTGHFQVLENFISLTPLRFWWISVAC